MELGHLESLVEPQLILAIWRLEKTRLAEDLQQLVLQLLVPPFVGRAILQVEGRLLADSQHIFAIRALHIRVQEHAG